MLTLLKKYYLLIFCMLFLVIYSCKRNYDTQNDLIEVSNFDDPNAKMNIPLAKQYYEKLKKDEGLYLKEINIKNKSLDVSKYKDKNRKYAIFKKAYESSTKRSTFVEVPLVYDHRVSSVILIEKSHVKSTKQEREEIFKSSFDRLILYKNKLTGKMNHRIITYIPDLKYLRKHNGNIKHNQINKLDNDFSGFIQYKKWDGTALYSLEYVNGKKTRYLPAVKGKNKKKRNNSLNEIICEDLLVEIWGESCVGAGPESDTDQECTPYLIESYYEEYCWEDEPEDPCTIDPRECGTGDPCIDFGECEGLPKDCEGQEGGSAYMTECGCVGGMGTPVNCPTDPCDRKNQISNQAQNTTLAGQNTSIQASTAASGHEYGAEMNLKTIGGNDYFNTTVRTDGSSNTFTPVFTWNASNGYTIGASHGHPGGSAPSPADAIWAFGNLTNPELIASGNIQFYKDNVSVITTTSNGNYIITVKDWAALELLYNAYQANPTQANNDYVAAGSNYYSNNSNVTNEQASAFALLSIYGNAINVFKAPPGSSTYAPIETNSSGQVAEAGCE